MDSATSQLVLARLEPDFSGSAWLGGSFFGSAEPCFCWLVLIRYKISVLRGINKTLQRLPRYTGLWAGRARPGCVSHTSKLGTFFVMSLTLSIPIDGKKFHRTGPGK